MQSLNPQQLDSFLALAGLAANDFVSKRFRVEHLRAENPFKLIERKYDGYVAVACRMDPWPDQESIVTCRP